MTGAGLYFGSQGKGWEAEVLGWVDGRGQVTKPPLSLHRVGADLALASSTDGFDRVGSPARCRPTAAARLCVHRITALWGLPLQVRRAVSVVLPGPIVHFINQRRWVVC